MVREKTRIILVRHGKTEAVALNGSLYRNPDARAINNLIDSAKANPEEVSLASVSMQVREPLAHLRPVLNEYAQIFANTTDFNLPILPSERERMGQVGSRLLDYLGKRNRLEVSDFRRAQDTARAMQDGNWRLEEIPIHINRRLREYGQGRDESKYPSRNLYFATHIGELAKRIIKGERYKTPGGESARHFYRKVKRQVRSEKYAWKYEGKTTVMVGHGENHRRHLKEYGLPMDFIPAGTITVLEAPARKPWEIALFRPRKYELVGQIGQRLVG